MAALTTDELEIDLGTPLAADDADGGLAELCAGTTGWR
jgi:hypothetical protein